MSSDTANLSTDDLAAAVRARAAGSPPDEAAADLLISGGWLDRADFRLFVDYTDDPDLTGDGSPLARVLWADVVAALDSGELRASGGPGRTLRIAASLGGGVPVNLRENATNSLGRAHAADVAAAITHATTS
ncbi:hypothetical protein [Amycolatopsis keratiniphila]|uniref:Uncharacterized protein n=1 Tax=Amycolatopsis keratiniphila subsp. keratiniphila TaxID=227715 RepID=A0A1W2M237_9PSEU|nr:hypothetical protein [Amycolatopsis keratiniphila]ONF73921.1 hypothetical protein AVR91_0204105 [Amycolatopsis keratiniphila subsp. keratiniphila]